jgi:hypothetical protein
MKNAIRLVLLLVLVTVSVSAQTPLPTEPPISHLILSGTATGFKGDTTTHPASIMYAGLQLTKTISVGYEQLQVSGVAVRGQFGIATYSNTVDMLLPKAVKSHLLFDPSNFVFTVGGGAGKFLTPVKNTIGETFHISLTYPMAAHVGWQIFGYQGFHAPGQFIGVNYSQTVSTGPVFYF